MKKHITVFKASLQDSFTYPAEIVVWMFVEFMPILMLSFVWLDVFERRSSIGGFTKEQLVSYYIGALIIGRFVSWYIHHDIAKEIRYGRLSPFLLKPYSYLVFRAVSNSAWRVQRYLILTPFLIFLLFSFRQYLYISLDFTSFTFMILAIVMAFFLFLSISLLLGIIGFWFEKVDGLHNLYWVLRNIFSGNIIPIVFLPPSFLLAAKILPFRYTFSFPLEIYFNQVSDFEIITGFIAGFSWLLLNFFLIEIFWDLGLKRYSSVGG